MPPATGIPHRWRPAGDAAPGAAFRARAGRRACRTATATAWN